MSALSLISPRKVRVSPAGVASFNRTWPCSPLRSSRAYWFEYDGQGNLINTDCPESDDGPAALSMSADCQTWLETGESPEWSPA